MLKVQGPTNPFHKSHSLTSVGVAFVLSMSPALYNIRTGRPLTGLRGILSGAELIAEHSAAAMEGRMDHILLLLDHKENRHLLAEWLGQQYQVTLADAGLALDRPFDLGILDGPALDRLWEQVQARKEAEQPVFLPFLLVASRRDVDLIARHLGRTVDELILTPIEKLELQGRVELLLRARRLSLELQTEAIAQLRASEERYHAISELISDYAYAFRVTPEGELRGEWLTESFTRAFGFTQAEVQARGSWRGMVHPDDMPIALEHVKRVVSGQVDVCELRFVTRTGEARWIRDYARPVWDEAQGRVVRIFGAAQDITERKRAEEALRRAHREWEDIFQAIGQPTLILDPQHNVIAANRAAARATGRSEKELQGRKCYEVFHGTSRPPEGCPLEKMLLSGQLETVEMEMEALGGTFLVSCTPVLDDEGRLQKVIHIATDITERKRLEHEAAERHLYLENVLACVPDAIVTLDAQHNVLEWNPGAEKLYGYSPEEVVGRNLDELIARFDARTFEEATGFTRQVLRGESLSPTETIRYRKDGSPVDVIVAAAPILSGDEVAGVVVVYTDITERKRLEAQVRQMQKMEALGQLAAGIAHDFNNLLTPISGFAELLLGKAPPGSQQQEYLHQIRVAARRASALTRQLRFFTRQEKGERRPVQLNSLVEETRNLLERSISKGIIIELNLEPELWAVEADPSQISQVLMNLCLNARDAMPEGGTLILETHNVTLDEEYARTVLEARPGRYVRLSVSDTGCGMSPQVQARLFEPFFTTKEAGKGTGLGLAVVYGIVKGHGGFINIYSQEGRGSTFHVYLPAIMLAVPEREVEGWELPTGRETILLVDDEEVVRALGQRVLESCGYTVLTAEDGIRALEVYQAHPGEIALVVLDLVMPRMGGLECLQRLRELDPQVKVLISTGYTARSPAQELVAKGALGVVEKPFRLRDFALAVRRALDER